MRRKPFYCGALGCLLGTLPLVESCDNSSYFSEDHHYTPTGQALGYNPEGTVHGNYEDMLFTLGFLKSRGFKPSSVTRNIDFDGDEENDIGIQVGNGRYWAQPSGNLNTSGQTLFWAEYISS